MRKSHHLALLGVLAAGDHRRAAAPPARKPVAKTPEASDQLDYVFFASDRPVLIRLHLRVGEKPYSAAFDDWMNKLFTWFDKNGDGSLDPTEAGRLQQANLLSFMLPGLDRQRQCLGALRHPRHQ